jgi:hypothetical protein
MTPLRRRMFEDTQSGGSPPVRRGGTSPRSVNSPSIATPVPIASARRVCAITSCTSPTRRKSPVRRPQSPYALAHDGGPVTSSSLQSTFRRALLQTGTAKRAHVLTGRETAQRLSSPVERLVGRHLRPDGTAYQPTGSRNPTSQWEPSQKGLFLDAPHRQSV